MGGIDARRDQKDLPTAVSQEVLIVQGDVSSRQAYINIQNATLMDYTFLKTRGQVKYKHRNGKISQVRAESAHCKFAAPSSPWVMNSSVQCG
jgi:hypothetical protein